MNISYDANHLMPQHLDHLLKYPLHTHLLFLYRLRYLQNGTYLLHHLKQLANSHMLIKDLYHLWLQVFLIHNANTNLFLLDKVYFYHHALLFLFGL